MDDDENLDRICSQCKEDMGEDGHFDFGDTHLQFCQPQCEYQYDIDIGLPDEYEIPWDYQGPAAHKRDVDWDLL